MINLHNFSDIAIPSEFGDERFLISKGGFPLQVFPEDLQLLIEDAGKKGLNPEMISGAILGTVSGALGSNFQLMTDNQKPALWIAIVAPSGIGKTPALKLATTPLTKKSMELRQGCPIPLSVIYGEKGKKGEPLQEKTIVIGDFTPEALVIKHKLRPRGLCVIVNELSGFFQQFGRYNKKGGDTQIYMNMWDGHHTHHDRVKASLSIESPFLPILGTIQPSEIRQIFNDGRDINGFAHRLLFVYLPDEVKKRRSTDPISEEASSKWESGINKLLDLDDYEKFEVHLSPGAKKIYEDFINVQNLELCNQATDRLRGLHSKFDIHVLRIAFVLQALKWAYSADSQFFSHIETQTMLDAIAVAEYFRKNALQIIEDGLAKSRPKTRIRELYDILPQAFGTQQAIESGNNLQISRRSVESYLQDTYYFTNTGHGQYQKNQL